MTSEAPDQVEALATRLNELSHKATADGNHDLASELANEAENLRDHALALVAEAYEAAAELAEKRRSVKMDDAPIYIRALTPDDALAAREARDKKVWEEALREVLEKEDSCGFVSREDILALIQGDTDE